MRVYEFFLVASTSREKFDFMHVIFQLELKNMNKHTSLISFRTNKRLGNKMCSCMAL
jgi:hypothetical protein